MNNGRRVGRKVIKHSHGIKLRQLQYFLAAAENLHFSRAAEQLFVTQPTLSHQIAELESHIGATLFDRSGKAVRLTEAGRLFQGHAARALKELDFGWAELRELEGLRRGELNIGANQSFVRRLLPPLLGEFISRYPAIRLNVQEMTAPEIERRLTAGTLDVGIAFAPSALDDTELEHLQDERMLLVVGPRHPYANRDAVRLHDLDNVPIVFFSSDFSTRQLVARHFEQAGVVLNIACETNSVELMLGLVMNAPLATILPASTLARTPGIRALPILDPEIVRVSALLWARQGFRSFAARTFAEMLREHFNTSAPAGR